MRNKLVPFFEPSSVAIIGASAAPGKAGNDVIKNILANGYAGKLYPVNPKGGKILGIDVCSSVASLPRDIDVAVIILPAAATAKAEPVAKASPVLIRADRSIALQSFVDVLDTVKALGFTTVSLQTESRP